MLNIWWSPHINKLVSDMQVIAEALGTFILMFCICGIIASTEIMEGQVGLLEYAVTATSTVIVVVFSIGAISGAHVNPAVTIAFATAGPFPWSKVSKFLTIPHQKCSLRNWCISFANVFQGSTIYIGTNIWCCGGNVCGKVSVWHKLRAYDHKTSPRMRFSLLFGAHCNLYHHVRSVFTNKWISISMIIKNSLSSFFTFTSFDIMKFYQVKTRFLYR